MDFELSATDPAVRDGAQARKAVDSNALFFDGLRVPAQDGCSAKA